MRTTGSLLCAAILAAVVAGAGTAAKTFSCNGLITVKALSEMTGRTIVAQPSVAVTKGRLINCNYQTDKAHLGTSVDLGISVGYPLESIATVKKSAVAPSADFTTGANPKWSFKAVPGLGSETMVGGYAPDVSIVSIVGGKIELMVHYTAMTYKHTHALSQAQVLAIARAVYAKIA